MYTQNIWVCCIHISYIFILAPLNSVCGIAINVTRCTTLALSSSSIPLSTSKSMMLSALFVRSYRLLSGG
uniref:Uncharacterized protein n=1 Tax=uncultured marine virus TaxID=186617 RepID=A0A0F7L4T5_9VIRU|nr:hypothetical protein [uncultured marine virus]